MKKTIVFISALFFLGSVAFAQNPQTQDKSTPASKSECPMKKDGKNCPSDKKDPKGCCDKSKATAKPAGNTKATETKKAEQTPEKK
jgi:hypothetical protein